MNRQQVAELGAELGSPGSKAQLSTTMIPCSLLKKERKVRFHPFPPVPHSWSPLPALLLLHHPTLSLRSRRSSSSRKASLTSQGLQDLVLFSPWQLELWPLFRGRAEAPWSPADRSKIDCDNGCTILWIKKHWTVHFKWANCMVHGL